MITSDRLYINNKAFDKSLLNEVWISEHGLLWAQHSSIDMKRNAPSPWPWEKSHPVGEMVIQTTKPTTWQNDTDAKKKDKCVLLEQKELFAAGEGFMKN